MTTKLPHEECRRLWRQFAEHLEANRGWCQRQLLAGLADAFGFDMELADQPGGRVFIIHPEATHLQGTIDAVDWISPAGGQRAIEAVRSAIALL